MTKQKKRAKSGFSLIEMLCALVVMVLVSCLMAVGVRVAVKAYNTEVMHSESQVLCSTIRTMVNDELRYAGTVDTSGNKIAFFSQNYGKAVSYSTNDDGQVVLGENKILASKSYPYGMKASVNIKSYDASTRIFSVDVKVTKSDGSCILAESSFQVKQLNKPASN
jgi:prepilin-type N-terminal cleavage/methylation domain-containing protein